MVRGPTPFGIVAVPPSPNPQLIINLGDAYTVNGQACPDAWVEGLWERPCETAATGATWLVGVQLHPWAGARLLDGDAPLCAGQVVDAHAFWGPEIRRARERLFDAATDEERAAVLERFLAARTRPAHAATEVALMRLVRSGGRSSVEGAAHAASMDVRTFRRRCERSLGIGPKRLARLVRFDRAVAALSGRRRVGWAAFAAEHGYYDQAHLIREFRELLGLTPLEFLTRRAVFGQYVVPIGGSTDRLTV
jgi:AraC-like DNA-binding protein